jgi:hypothetical protein
MTGLAPVLITAFIAWIAPSVVVASVSVSLQRSRHRAALSARAEMTRP